MSYKVISTKNFRKQAKSLIKKYRSLKHEIYNIAEKLEINPKLGVSIGNRCYKIRIAIESKNKGKSGGARPITYCVTRDKIVYMAAIYDKSEKSSISEKELQEIIDSLEM